MHINTHISVYMRVCVFVRTYICHVNWRKPHAVRKYLGWGQQRWRSAGRDRRECSKQVTYRQQWKQKKKNKNKSKESGNKTQILEKFFLYFVNKPEHFDWSSKREKREKRARDQWRMAPTKKYEAKPEIQTHTHIYIHTYIYILYRYIPWAVFLARYFGNFVSAADFWGVIPHTFSLSAAVRPIFFYLFHFCVFHESKFGFWFETLAKLLLTYLLLIPLGVVSAMPLMSACPCPCSCPFSKWTSEWEPLVEWFVDTVGDFSFL